MASKFKNDPDNYYKMSEPHENPDKANEALQKFYDKVSEARKEFKIADILVITTIVTVLIICASSSSPPPTFIAIVISCV